ncbi:MAG: hypothetical protein OEZ58_17690 [Gammaproteobacteria bacterium]|nr:hypothetical protein [Gammaproteobacteria bacterium]MDH5730825.1 hypothetical protein [Gammaproteobacteria bacterium]
MKAEKFKLVVTGEYNGRPYKYEEEVPANDYQVTGWKLKLMPKFKQDMIEQLNQAQVGDYFKWDDGGCITEIQAI